MRKPESIEDYFKERGNIYEIANQFNVFEREQYSLKPLSYNRRDFYKISLLQGESRLMFAETDILIDKPALSFANPLTPYSWEPITKEQPGYFCLFKEEFLTEPTESLQQSDLFMIGKFPIFFLDDKQLKKVSTIFENMLSELNTDYVHKYDVLRNQLNLLMHEAVKLQPNTTFHKHNNASERITSLFLEILERQFPIDNAQQTLKLRTAKDYASSLSVHVNHLNHAVKKVTDKSTSTHISDRILQEAKALLTHTDWSVANIAYSLGFEYPTYFNNFFKSKTGNTPKQIREQIV